MATATAKRAREISRALNSHVNAVLMALAALEIERETMSTVDAALLAEYEYIDQYDGTRITDPKNHWHIKEEDEARFYARRDEEIRKLGYNLPSGHCPALTAECIHRDAEHALIAAAEPFFGVDLDRIICSGIDNYHKYIDLLTKLVVNAPGYRPAKF